MMDEELVVPETLSPWYLGDVDVYVHSISIFEGCGEDTYTC